MLLEDGVRYPDAEGLARDCQSMGTFQGTRRFLPSDRPATFNYIAPWELLPSVVEREKIEYELRGKTMKDGISTRGTES